MGKIIVTGGAGYIGSAVANLFCKCGYDVVVIDYNLKDDTDEIVKINIDIRNQYELDNVFRNNLPIDCVIHCAGELGIERSYAYKELFYDQIVYGTDNVLRMMIKYGVKKLIYSSTAAVYTNVNRPVCESDTINVDQLSPYSLFKYMCEQKIQMLRSCFDYCCLRYFNVVGIGCDDNNMRTAYLKKNNILPILINSALNNWNFGILGLDYETKDGTCERDYIDLKDLSYLHLAIYVKMNSSLWNKKLNGIYNAGSGKTLSVKELIKLVEKVTCRRILQENKPRRIGDITYLCSDNSKTNKVFEWKPSINIEDTIQILTKKS